MKKTRQVLAIIGVILLVVLYALTLITAIFDTSKTMGYFKASVAMTILVPVLLYAYTLFYKLLKKDKDE